MALTEEQFEALVNKLEKTSRANPEQYRMKVGLLAVLGYAYIFLMLGICLALIGLIALAMISGHFNIAFIKVGIVLVLLVGTILRSMWVKLEPPNGIPLTPQQTPELFAMLDSVSTKLDAPRFHHVLLVDEFNAAVYQVPKLGIFGWQVNYLLIGLPLIQALSPEEFESVVAHEMGHLSGNHSRFSGWIYRVRQTWMHLLTALTQQRHKGAALFMWFFKWYSPYFAAYSFVLARANEYEADRCAATVAGAETAAKALLRIPVQGRMLHDQYWPSIFAQSYKQPEPPVGVFTNLRQAVQQPVERALVQQWVVGALREKTDVDDTHPSMTDRISALGFYVGQSQSNASLQFLSDDIRPVAKTAAEQYLGAAQAQLTATLDTLWRQSVINGWRQKFQYAQQATQNLQGLEQKVLVSPLTVDEQFNRARWTAEIVGNTAGIPLIQAFTEANPGHVGGLILLGQCLLEENDGAGIAPLERAMNVNPDTTLIACQFIHKYLRDQGRFAEADQYLNRARGRMRLEEDAEEERAQITPNDKYLPHGLDANITAAIAAKIQGEKDVAEAYLVRKEMTLLQERPLYIIGIFIKAPWYKPESEDAHSQLVQRLLRVIDLPGQTFIVSLEQQFKGSRKRMQAIPGAEIYRRGRR